MPTRLDPATALVLIDLQHGDGLRGFRSARLASPPTRCDQGKRAGIRTEAAGQIEFGHGLVTEICDPDSPAVAMSRGNGFAMASSVAHRAAPGLLPSRGEQAAGTDGIGNPTGRRRSVRLWWWRNGRRAKLLCVVKGCFGGAGRPVMGHSGEGELVAIAPRVDCAGYGVTVAVVPWARHGSSFTRAFEDLVCWEAVVASKQTAVVVTGSRGGR
jgi:hypothetical protein